MCSRVLVCTLKVSMLCQCFLPKYNQSAGCALKVPVLLLADVSWKKTSYRFSGCAIIQEGGGIVEILRNRNVTTVSITTKILTFRRILASRPCSLSIFADGVW